MKDPAREMESEMQQDANPTFRFKRSNKRPRHEAAQEEVIFESKKIKGKVVYFMSDIAEHGALTAGVPTALLPVRRPLHGVVYGAFQPSGWELWWWW